MKSQAAQAVTVARDSGAAYIRCLEAHPAGQELYNKARATFVAAGLSLTRWCNTYAAKCGFTSTEVKAALLKGGDDQRSTLIRRLIRHLSITGPDNIRACWSEGILEPTPGQDLHNRIRSVFVWKGTTMAKWCAQHDMAAAEARRAIFNPSTRRARNLRRLLLEIERRGLTAIDGAIQEGRIDLNQYSTSRNIALFRRYVAAQKFEGVDLADYTALLEQHIRADRIDCENANWMLIGYVHCMWDHA